MNEENLDKPAKQERRGRVVLNAEIQMYYFSSIALSALLMIGAFLSLLLFSGYTNLSQNWVALTAMMIMFALAPAFGIHSIFHSHRIAGPLHHIQKGMKKLTEGHLDTAVELRQKDYLQNVAQTFNKLAQSLQKKQAKWDGFTAELKTLATTLPEEFRTKLEGLLDELEE